MASNKLIIARCSIRVCPSQEEALHRLVEIHYKIGLEGEAIFMMRAGHSRSPRYNTLAWVGDQLVTWDEHDGLKSSLRALISSGISGFSINHICANR